MFAPDNSEKHDAAASNRARDLDLQLRRALKRVVCLDEAFSDSYGTLVATARGAHDGNKGDDMFTRRRSGSSVDQDSDPVVAALPGLMVRAVLLRWGSRSVPFKMCSACMS
jgi:hypothetical protein